MSKMRYKLLNSAFALLVIVLVAPLNQVQGIDLVDPHDPNVRFNSTPVNEYYSLSIDENVNSAILFYIVNVNGSNIGIEYTDPVSICPTFSIAVDFQKINDTTWYSKLTAPLDYEQNNCQLIDASITDEQSLINFQLKVINLNDNDPILVMSSYSGCTFNENTDYPKGNENCTLKMTDADGMMEDTIFTTIEEGQINQTFMAEFMEIPTDDQKEARVSVYLVDNTQLDYETQIIHIFTVQAVEDIRNTTAQVLLNVGDMPDQPPKWIQVITAESFPENVNQTFQVKAVDGDVGINSTISYDILKNGCDGYTCEIKIDENNGSITVGNVDREEVGDTIQVTLNAIEQDDNSSTPLSVVFLIEDQDDNIPSITFDGKTMDRVEIQKDENYVGSIIDFDVTDMDLGDNGTYTITLAVPDNTENYTKAFQVIPTSGYNKGHFTITVLNSTYLDYENPIWRNITFQLIATEKANTTHLDSVTIAINLNDLNDEYPVFCNPNDTVSVLESIGKGEIVFNASATDADANDVVTYVILGIWSEKLNIDQDGIITPITDNVFDYEQLEQVIIQIQASDKVEHHTFKTLTIMVEDVDDEPPSIKVILGDNGRVAVKENSPAGTILDANITASDPDTKPNLTLTIDWDGSSVTKNSVPLDLEDDSMWHCFELQTQPAGQYAQNVYGILKISEICSPDFELFDAITISLKVVDENTVIGQNYSMASVTVNIEDVNDNPPVFVNSSLMDLEVSDNTTGIAKIGIIAATDVDIGDKVTYAIKAMDTSADWVDIDENNGTLFVREGLIIDDDVPARENISFNISASDTNHTHTTSVVVYIAINDVNDRTPKIQGEQPKVHIKEKSNSGVPLPLNLTYQDLDRDVPFHTVVFQFYSNITNEAANLFDISKDGSVMVFLRNGAKLDRDRGPGSYILPILAYDNPTGVLQLKDFYDLTVVLDDINDNIPVILNKSLDCSEIMKKNDQLGPIIAQDLDEGENAEVSFTIVTIEAIGGSKELKTSSFEILPQDDNKTVFIKILQDLQGYYGQYNLTIKTEDHGNPPLSQNNSILLNVEKFNFQIPVFVYPESNANILLDDDPELNAALIFYNGSRLPDFEVDDLQDHKYNVSFSIIDKGNGNSIFNIIQVKSYTARLELTRSLTDDDKKVQSITIAAALNADQQPNQKPTTASVSVNIQFFSTDDTPTFSETNCTISFQENCIGPPQAIPQASYPVDNFINPVYKLLDSIDVFNVNPVDGNISPLQELDYETTPSYDIRIAALNKESSELSNNSQSILYVHVKVIDMNDHIPIFYPSKFYGAFLKTYNDKSTIVTITATDGDPRDEGNLHFEISNITCTGNLHPQDPAFKIGERDGKVTPTFAITSDMNGYCMFPVNVTDNPDPNGTVHTVSTTVQINIISDDDLVEFVFMNKDQDVVKLQETIQNTIDVEFKNYNYESFMADDVYSAEYGNTTAHFYFLDSITQTPVEASEILGNLTDFEKFTQLKKNLARIDIYLGNFPSSNVVQEVMDYMKIWLMVTTFVLASLLMVLSIGFFFRNRALTQRIKNLSTTKFGSQESGLNRAGVAAPTTNKHAVEGSNPVYNSENYKQEIEAENDSGNSDDDSDLFGVENNPEFDI